MNVLWQCPPDAIASLVLAHGAGAGMSHTSMQAIADAFERRGIATLRFNFPFMDAGKNRTDPPAVATASIALRLRNPVPDRLRRRVKLRHQLLWRTASAHVPRLSAKSSERAAIADDRMVDEQHDHGADDGNDHAVNV